MDESITLSWLAKPGDLCSRRLHGGDHLTGVCNECGHIDYLHSSDRACIGCESIAEAIKAARQTIKDAVRDQRLR